MGAADSLSTDAAGSLSTDAAGSLSTDAAGSLSSSLVALVDVISALYPTMLEQTGLSRLRWAILHLARAHEPITMSRLSARLDLPKSNLTYHVDWLEENGFLERAADEADRRLTHLLVTHAGAALVEQVPADLKRRVARLAASVTPEELSTMAAGLALFVKASARLFEA